MTTFKQTPAPLNIEAISNDDFEFYLDFDISLSGYSFVSNIILSATNEEISMGITGIDLNAGQIKIFMAQTGMASLPIGTHKWYADWDTGTQTRRILAGDFKVSVYGGC
jgi:hypothetical protein